MKQNTNERIFKVFVEATVATDAYIRVPADVEDVADYIDRHPEKVFADWNNFEVHEMEMYTHIDDCINEVKSEDGYELAMKILD